MDFSWLRITTLILAGFLFIGCSTDKKDSIRDHSGAVNDQLAAPSEVPLREALQAWENLNWNQIKANSQTNDRENLKSVVQQLAPFFLEEKILSQPDFWQKKDYETALIYFNTSLIRLYRLDPKSEFTNGQLQKMKSVMLSGCSAKSINDCPFLIIFKNDSQSSYFAKIFAQREDQVSKKFMYFYLAYTLSGNRWDNDLAQDIFLSSLSMFKKYALVESMDDSETRILKLKSLNDEQRAELRLFTQLFSTIVAKVDVPGTEKYQAILMEYFRWLESGNFEKVFGRNLYDQLSDLISRNFDSQVIKNIFKDLIISREKQDPESYTNQLAYILKVGGKVLENLNIQPIDVNTLSQSDESLVNFYIIRRLYHIEPGRFHIKLWESIQSSPESFLSLLENYLQIYFIKTVVDANLKLSNFFKMRIQAGEDRKEVVRKTFTYARSAVASLWSQYRSHLNQVQPFFLGEFRQVLYGNQDHPHKDLALRIERLMGQQNLNIKLISEYPHLFVLGYYAVKTGYEEKIKNSQGHSAKLDADIFVNWLFKGSLPPILQYQEESKPLDKIQINKALYYAIKMNVAQMFDLEIKDFLGLLLDRYTVYAEARLKFWNEDLNARTASHSKFADFKNICDALGENPQGILNFSRAQMDLSDFNTGVFFGVHMTGNDSLTPLKEGVNTISNSKSGAPPLKYMLDEAVEVLRSDVDPKLRALQVVREVTAQILGETHSAIQTFDTQFNEIFNNRNHLYSKIAEVVDVVPQCWNRFLWAEWQRRRDIFELNVSYSKDVFNLITALKELDQYRHTSVKEVKTQVGHSIFDQYTDLNEDLPLWKSINQWLMDASHLSTYAKINTEFNENYQSKFGIQRNRSGNYYWVEGKHYLFLRMAYFMMRGYRGQKLTFQSKNLSVEIPTTTRSLVLKFNQNTGYKQPQLDINPRSIDDPNWSSQDLFVSDMVKFMRRHTGGLFYKQGEVYKVRDIIRGSIAAFRYKYERKIKTSEITGCDQECVQQEYKDMEEQGFKIANNVLQFLEFFNLDPRNERMRRYFHDTDLYSNSLDSTWKGPNKLFMEIHRQRYNALLTDAFTFLISGRLGHKAIFERHDFESLYTEYYRHHSIIEYVYNKKETVPQFITRKNIFWESQNEYKSLKYGKDLLIFPIDEKISDMIEESAKYMIRTQMRVAHGFMMMADAFADEVEIPPFHFDTTIDAAEPGVLPNNDIRAQYLYDMVNYNRSTHNVYFPTELTDVTGWKPTKK